jgi:NADP-dependent aldehyde dehydrogenase
MLMPLGPVAVFGASNFPLAFSVAGGDTASALAAGCPVVYKPNPGHPETSAMVANAVLRIVKNRQLPHGTFGMTSQDLEAGRILALDPKIMAIGFTGSLRGGRALFDLAAGRPNPIPVYAEMGSVNPVVVMPHAVSNRREAIAKGYAQSLTMGVGQFCTNPGLLIGVDSPEFQQLVDQIAGQVSQAPPAPMLHPGIHESYVNGVKRMAETDQVTVVVAHQSDATLAGPGLFQTTADVARANPEVLEEVFGPAGLVISCNDLEDLTDLIASLPGQLTASVLLDDAEIEAARPVISAMAGIAGRVVLNGYPTGVEVHSAMQHGGPYPATTDSRSTSVGTAAILRFVRPICFQGFPTQLLPDALKDENPGKISRTVNGTLTNGQL